MKPISIPIGFLLARTGFNWSEAQYGLARGWLDARAMIDLALTALEEKTDSSPLEARLAGLRENETWDVPRLVEGLAKSEPKHSIEESKKKWLCLILAWVYENRDDFDDPIAIVDEIYDDFDYPQEIKGFVSYMPLPELSSIPPYKAETPRERMLRLWKEYVDHCHDKTAEAS
jgi:hypothetical protein